MLLSSFAKFKVYVDSHIIEELKFVKFSFEKLSSDNSGKLILFKVEFKTYVSLLSLIYFHSHLCIVNLSSSINLFLLCIETFLTFFPTLIHLQGSFVCIQDHWWSCVWLFVCCDFDLASNKDKVVNHGYKDNCGTIIPSQASR